jgi:cytochrome c
MKKTIATLALASLLMSCGDKKKETTEAQTPTTETTVDEGQAAPVEAEIPAEFKKGADLIAANDCLGCHKIDEKLVGPSYKEVAAKYTVADVEVLAQTIISGGKGHWGEIPMTAHAGSSKPDAIEMVKYILSLK